MPSCTTTRRVEFHDTDMAGVMHFTGYFRFMEAAEHSLLRSLGVNVLEDEEGQILSWPRIQVDCQYRLPARFGDEVQVEAAVERLGAKSLTVHFLFRCRERELAEGRMTSVCCRVRPGEPFESTSIPARIRHALGG